MPSASTKPIQVIYFALTTPADMVAAQEAMLAVDYTGVLVCSKDSEGTVAWRLQISASDEPRRITASLGDVLVYDATTNHLDAMDSSTFTANYTV